MAATLPATDPLSRLNSIHATSARVEESGALAILRRVHHELQHKQQAAASAAGVKESQYSAALHGTGNFSIAWLWAQEDAFFLRWVSLALDAKGLNAEKVKSVRAIRILELVQLLMEEGF